MYSKTRFGQLLEGLPRSVFERHVRDLNADKYSKGFRRWDQLLAMIFAQVSGVKSLRELETAFNEQKAHHYHLGTQLIKRSTLADANTNRSSEIFSAICNELMKGVHRRLRKELGDMLYLLDSTLIHLEGFGFDDWASEYRNNVSQGLKLHMMIEGREPVPVFVKITGAQSSDIKNGREIELESNAIYLFDMGYYDYNWWHEIEETGSTFVTRLKKNANIRVCKHYPIPSEAEHILEDAEIKMNNRYVKSRTEKNVYYGKRLRRITVERPDKDTPMILVTNNFELSAKEIAELYKKRWGIELFFKWIKQNLKIKTYLGRSENAARTQIFTALISYLLLYIFRQKQSYKNSFKLCLSALRYSLFQRTETEQIVHKRERQRRDYLDEIQPQLAF